MSKSEIEVSVLLGEKSALRDELKHLKLCQLSYFTISVTTTGALLGLGSKLGPGPFPALLYFSPLVIILPCWWIFFDKATTIARIVGYLTILDRILSQPETAGGYRYVGWEAALYYYRSPSGEKQVPARDRSRRWGRGFWLGLTRVLTFRTSHRYWSINYYTYTLLALVCWVLGSSFPSGLPLSLDLLSKTSLVLLAVILTSCLYNLYLVGDLIGGSRSYNAHVKAWGECLRAGNAELVLGFAHEEPGEERSRQAPPPS